MPPGWPRRRTRLADQPVGGREVCTTAQEPAADGHVAPGTETGFPAPERWHRPRRRDRGAGTEAQGPKRRDRSAGTKAQGPTRRDRRAGTEPARWRATRRDDVRPAAPQRVRTPRGSPATGTCPPGASAPGRATAIPPHANAGPPGRRNTDPERPATPTPHRRAHQPSVTAIKRRSEPIPTATPVVPTHPPQSFWYGARGPVHFSPLTW